MKSGMNRCLIPGIAALALCAPIAAPAQETRGSIRGTVRSGERPVADARITIVHLPSGTTTRGRTGRNGAFVADGLRVGGPFAVTVEAAGFEQLMIRDVALEAGAPLRLPIAIATEQQMLASVAGLRTAVLRDGPGTVFGRAEIDAIGSIARDPGDVLRRAPLAGSQAIVAGDGVRGFGTVPLDAVEEVALKPAPYDIGSGALSGAAADVVLRAGDNRFAGSGFARSGDLAGDAGGGGFGGFLSGPIARDRLFFAVSHEQRRGGRSSARLDWNVAEGQRASASYRRTDGAARVDAGAIQLDSDWSDAVSSGARLTAGRARFGGVVRESVGGEFALRWRAGDHAVKALVAHRKATLIRYSSGGQDGRTRLSATSAALQDDWAISRVWTVSYGMRMEESGQGGSAIQPRFALTWQPRRRLVVRGGIGRFGGEDLDLRRAAGWRSSLSLDYTLDLGPFGDGWRFGGDLLRVTGVRIPLDPVARTRSAAVARVGTEWDFGLAANLSYTFADAGDGSRLVARRGYKVALDYVQAFVGAHRTHFGLFAERAGGMWLDLHLDQEVPAPTGVEMRLFADVENLFARIDPDRPEDPDGYGEAEARPMSRTIRLGAKMTF